MDINDDENIRLNRQMLSSSSNSNNYNRNNRSQFYVVFVVSLVVMFVAIIISVYNVLPECLFKHTIHTWYYNNNNKNVQNDITIRSLNNELNSNDTVNDTNQTFTTVKQIPSKQTLIDLYSTKYEFISNLSTEGYFGKYSNLQMKHYLFKQNYGDVELFFYKLNYKIFFFIICSL